MLSTLGLSADNWLAAQPVMVTVEEAEDIAAFAVRSTAAPPAPPSFSCFVRLLSPFRQHDVKGLSVA